MKVMLPRELYGWEMMMIMMGTVYWLVDWVKNKQVLVEKGAKKAYSTGYSICA